MLQRPLHNGRNLFNSSYPIFRLENPIVRFHIIRNVLNDPIAPVGNVHKSNLYARTIDE